MGQILCNDKGKTGEAQAKLNEVRKTDKDFENVRCLELDGDILLKIDESNNSQAALELYNRALKEAPKDFDCLIKAGKCYDRSKDF